MNEKILLEKEAKMVIEESTKSPLIFQTSPEEGRTKLEEAQSSIVYKYPAKTIETEVNTGKNGTVKVYIIIPQGCNNIPNVIFYIHGAGWMFGSFHTHEKLVKELAFRTNSIVIFPEYSRAPEAQFPIAIEQCYYILCRIKNILKFYKIKANLSNLTVAGDSVGGNMAIAMTLIAKYNNGPKIGKQLLYYPVTNAKFDTESYDEFASGYYLYKDSMKLFWDQYAPSEYDRNSILASPLRASINQLTNLPDAMIINGEVDVLRDEGEAYADKLRKAGNDVTSITFRGTIHDFVMLNSLDQSNSTRAAMDASIMWINRKS